jgi:Ca2+-binding RTX toxin-like protein
LIAAFNDWNSNLLLLSDEGPSFEFIIPGDFFVPGLPNGRDLAFAGFGNDTIYADTNDTVFAGAGDDTVIGRTSIFGGAGADSLQLLEAGVAGGGAGNDTITGSMGADTLFGGADADLIRDNNDDVGDLIFGGAGIDTIAISAGDTVFGGDSADSIRASPEGSTLVFGGGGGDYIRGSGNGFSDTLGGGEGSDTILGRGGDDVLFGGSGSMDGADSIVGDGGADTIFGGDADTVTGGQEADLGDDDTDRFDFTGSNLSNAAVGIITDFEVGLDKLVVLQGATITASLSSIDVMVDLNGDGTGDVRIINGAVNGFSTDDFA